MLFSQPQCGFQYLILPDEATGAIIPTYIYYWVWGNNGFFTFGNGSSVNKSSPIPVYNTGVPWLNFSVGQLHAGGIDINDNLWVWGFNDKGQVGDGTTATKSLPVSIAGGGAWQQYSASRDVSIGLKTDGTAWTWGYNIEGALGNGTAGITSGKSSPVSVLGGHTFQFVNCGYRHAGGITTGGRLYLWGSNDYGELGQLTSGGSILSPVSCTNFDTWTSIALGRHQSAGLAGSGTLWTWGNNNVGQLGDGTTSLRSSPVSISDGWSQISASFNSDNMAGIKTDGSLWTWGNNDSGQLGTNDLSSRITPTQIASGNTWLQVSCGDFRTHALRSDRTLWGCGYNNNGQIGDGTTTGKSSLVQVSGRFKNVQSLATAHDFAAAIKTDGTLWTWGSNNVGQLATNNTTSRSSPGTTIGAGTTWSTLGFIGGGTTTNCAAIKSDGTLWTWGSNDYGQLADGTTFNRSSPVSVSGTTWSSVYVGKTNMLGIKTDGTLWSWGAGNNGAIGDGTTNDRTSPVQVAGGGTTWTTAACGYRSSLAIKGGVLWAWGYNIQGQLGTGNTSSYSSPVSIAGGASDWSQVSCGYRHTAAVKTDGTLWTWGANSFGQLGDNSGNSRSSPDTTIGGGTNWSFVACGYRNTAAIKTDGTLWTWGTDSYGQLGDDSLTGRSSPVTTAIGGTNWNRVYVGSQHMVAVKTDGVLWVWGRNNSGQLAINSTSSARSPVVSTGDPDSDWAFVNSGTLTAMGLKVEQEQ